MHMVSNINFIYFSEFKATSIIDMFTDFLFVHNALFFIVILCAIGITIFSFYLFLKERKNGIIKKQFFIPKDEL